jgi:putative thioredoxin
MLALIEPARQVMQTGACRSRRRVDAMPALDRRTCLKEADHMLLNESAPGAAAPVKDTTTQTFVADVLEESKNQPVLVDFWAPWCGPCRQLGPVLERVVAASNGKVKLVKMNIDEHPAVANQLKIQSIPAVIAFTDGRAVDGFMGAIPESQVREFIDRLGGPAGEAEEVATLLDAADEALSAQDAAGAAELYAAVLSADAQNLRAVAGLARTKASTGDLDGAKALLATVPPAKAGDADIAAVRAQIALTERTAELGDTAEFKARLGANANDHQARYDLALALAAAGRREEALDELLDIVRRDRAWNDDSARKQIVQLFEAWGPTDPLTVSGRRRLSALLFA